VSFDDQLDESPVIALLRGRAGLGRTIVTFSTASIAVSATENDDVTIAKGAVVLSVTTNRPARVRAYSSSAHRTADAARAAGTDPTGNHGCLMDVVTAAGLLTIDTAPLIGLANMDGTPVTTIYFATQNLDAGAGVVTVALTVRQAE
jgi:hypothetical protein